MSMVKFMFRFISGSVGIYVDAASNHFKAVLDDCHKCQLDNMGWNNACSTRYQYGAGWKVLMSWCEYNFYFIFPFIEHIQVIFLFMYIYAVSANVNYFTSSSFIKLSDPLLSAFCWESVRVVPLCHVPLSSIYTSNCHTFLPSCTNLMPNQITLSLTK